MSHAMATRTTYGPPTYLGEKTGLASWLFTTDHKRIAILYGHQHHGLLPDRRGRDQPRAVSSC